ncbi:MAG: GLPGLI family protein [Muribaculaceae bacterium]|nr:GLPGLI family protein [Muribaculaceae bacterium]
MKQIIATAVVMAASAVYASSPAHPELSKADIIVSYDENSMSWEKDSLQTIRMSLLANTHEAKYFNDLSLWTDSLKSTPEGKDQWTQIIMAACVTQSPEGGLSIDLSKGPVKKTYTYVFTNPETGNLRYYSKFGDEIGYYDEPLTEMEWEICDSVKTVLGYECVKAATDYHGRRWTAWFTTDIPVPFGPWKLHGLPGLILMAEADNGNSFVATGIEKTDRIISPMYSADEYDRKDRRKALAETEYFLNNRESIMIAKHGGSVKFAYDPAERPKYDAVRYANEPDYQ